MSDWITTCNERPEWLSREDLDANNERWCLVLVWSAAEPERIGETAFVDEMAGILVLGRGGPTPSDPSERLLFFRQRPGSLIPTPPLKGDGLSRKQCLIHVDHDKISLQNVGRAPLFVDGAEQTSARIGVGQLVTIRDQLVLYCTRQPPIARLRHFPAHKIPAFGAPDEFGIVGEHRATWELRDQLAFYAASNHHVLILGESGSGKELAARGLHLLSHRSKQELVARNAATLPSALIDAELFGNAENFPTLGTAARPGIIGQADGSTLFLDEFAELPADLQAHLLRVLDRDGEYQRLGDAQSRRSDFRLVAATNRDPSELRLDILGRLTLQIQLPNLADRAEDIPLLTRHLLERAASTSPELRDRFFACGPSGPQPRIDPDLVEALMQHRFTYHIRELESLLWRAVAESPKNFVALTRSIRQELGVATRRAPAIASMRGRIEPTAEHLIECLNRNQGNVARSAEALGLSSRYALYRLMRRYGISVGPSGDAVRAAAQQ